MVASACCSRVVSLATVVLALCSIATSQQSKCSKINYAIEYKFDRCIFVKQWFPSTMQDAKSACRNLSDDLVWTLPKFDSATSRDKMTALVTAIWNKSIKKTVFWMGLVRKNTTWKWLQDDSEMDETRAVWKKGGEQADTGNCVLGKWEEVSAVTWIPVPCQNGSMALSSKEFGLLVCESMPQLEITPSGRKRKIGKPKEPPSNHTSTITMASLRPASKKWSTESSNIAQDPGKRSSTGGPETWHWIVLGICLAVITAFIIFGAVFYVKRRRRKQEQQALLSRRDPLSRSSGKSKSTTDDSIRAFFHASPEPINTKKEEVTQKLVDAPKNPVANDATEKSNHGKEGLSTDSDDFFTASSNGSS